MNPISAFFVRNIVLVFFFYGMAFFAMGLALALASRRTSQFRFAQAIRPLAAFGIVHGIHEWIEMFQKIAALTTGYIPTAAQELLRLALLVLSLLMLLAFGLMLLNPALDGWRLLRTLFAITGLWLVGTVIVIVALGLALEQAIAVSEVLARYGLAIPGALLGAWALMTQQRTFREHGMPQFGRDLVWSATALILYGVIGQIFVRETILVPSNILNSTIFLQWFGIPVQLFRGIMAAVAAVFMVRALNAFELESQRRLDEANQARLQAQADALEAERRISRQMERLNEELRESTRELSLLLDLLNLLAVPMTLEDRLRSVLDRLVQSLEFPNAGMVLLAARGSGVAEIRAHCGYQLEQTETRDSQWWTWSQELGKECATRRIVICRHLDGSIQESTFEEAIRQPQCHLYASPAIVLGLSLMAQERVIGSIVLAQTRDEGRRAPTIEELRLIVSIAGQLGLSIENARLYEQAQEREQVLGQLLHQVVGAQEAERQRIARELHDATGQSLTAIALGLRGIESMLQTLDPDCASLAEQISELKAFGTSALGELRQIIADLRPSILDDMGLVAALKWYLQEFEHRNALEATFILEGESLRLPSEYETVLFRIAQEALTNIAKHARATRVTVVLHFAPESICLIVEDDGVGFDPEQLARGRDLRAGWGLLGIQERVALLSGRCAIDSEPGRGTRVWVSIPYAAGRSVDSSYGGSGEGYAKGQAITG